MRRNIISLTSFLLFILSLIAGYFYLKSQKVAEDTPKVTSSPVTEIKSQVYKNDILGFELTLPDGLAAEEKTEGKVVIIGDKILVYELDSNPEFCKGVCSVLTKKEDVTTNDIKMRYLEGYWGELGEDNAQSFVSYVITKNDKYLVFILQELPTDAVLEAGREVGEISKVELEMFKTMVSSINLI